MRCGLITVNFYSLSRPEQLEDIECFLQLLNTMLFIRLANSLLVDKYNIDAHLYARYLCLREIFKH